MGGMQKHPLLRTGIFLVKNVKIILIYVKYVVFARCIHAAVIRSAAWEATATALTTLPLGALTAAGGRSAAIEMPCAAPATAAVTVSIIGSPSPAKSPGRDSMLTSL